MIVIGSGIIGAAIACRLSLSRAKVTVLDAGPAGAGATAASFGWINASFFLNRDHFALRETGIAAWHRLAAETGGLPISWKGCLWWEEEGDGFDALQAELSGLGYPAEVLGRARFAALEPAIANPPARALFLAAEGAAESAAVAQNLLDVAADHGATVCTGVRVQQIETRNGRIIAVQTAQGRMAADQVVLAAGTGAAGLLAPLDVDLPLLPRPGVTVVTRPEPPLLSHVLVAPGQELRQLPDGRILAPTSAKHQEDNTSEITEPLSDLAQRTRDRLEALLPGAALTLQSTALTMRPVPGDGLPVIGPAGPDGLYVSVMHSGVTLAAVVAELAVRELMGQGPQNQLGPYRLDRFADGA